MIFLAVTAGQRITAATDADVDLPHVLRLAAGDERVERGNGGVAVKFEHLESPFGPAHPRALCQSGDFESHHRGFEPVETFGQAGNGGH